MEHSHEISARLRPQVVRLIAGPSAVIAVVLISPLASAQTDSNPKWDVLLGYQYLHPGITVPAGDPNKPSAFKVPDMSPGLGSSVTYSVEPARIAVIKLASNRRVDLTLKAAGRRETSVRTSPFNATDSLRLIAGREAERTKTAKPAPKKRTMKKP
jgi:hypothetical protein